MLKLKDRLEIISKIILVSPSYNSYIEKNKEFYTTFIEEANSKLSYEEKKLLKKYPESVKYQDSFNNNGDYIKINYDKDFPVCNSYDYLSKLDFSLYEISALIPDISRAGDFVSFYGEKIPFLAEGWWDLHDNYLDSFNKLKTIMAELNTSYEQTLKTMSSISVLLRTSSLTLTSIKNNYRELYDLIKN